MTCQTIYGIRLVVKKVWNLENLRFQIFILLPKTCYELGLRLKSKASFFYWTLKSTMDPWQNFCYVFLQGVI